MILIGRNHGGNLNHKRAFAGRLQVMKFPAKGPYDSARNKQTQPRRRRARLEGLEQALGRRYLPFAIQLRLTSARQRRLAGSLPFIAAMAPVDGKTSVYVCRDRTCRAPATEIDDLEGALAS